MGKLDRRYIGLAALGSGLMLGAGLLRRARALQLRGKTVVITGSSRGLGLVLARQLGREGCRLVLAARDADALERAREELAAQGCEVLAVPCDVSDPAQVAQLVDAATARFGDIDVLINNAGLIQVGPTETMLLEDYRHAMETHFWAPLYTTLAVLPQMKARRAGRIVNVSSIGGLIPIPHMLPYTASKFALVGLSEGLHAELAKDGIVVTTVCPGLVRTGSPRNASFKSRHRDEFAWLNLFDSNPVTSMSAESAARRIVRALRHGESRVVLSLHAKAAALAHALAPGLFARAAGLVNRALPAPGGIGYASARGTESGADDTEQSRAVSALTGPGARAALRNNEVPGPAR